MTNETMAMNGAASATESPVYIHPLAEVEEGAVIGAGTKIWRFAHVRAGAVIGENSMVGGCCFIDSGVTIGNRVRIQNGVLVYNGVTIEDEVFLGPNMVFTNDLYPRADGRHWTIVPTHVCRGASIGANATIVCNTTIGEYALVAAGSVVTKDVAPCTLVRGNPAQPVGQVCLCGKKLRLDSAAGVASCQYCGREVRLRER